MIIVTVHVEDQTSKLISKNVTTISKLACMPNARNMLSKRYGISEGLWRHCARQMPMFIGNLLF